MADETQNSEWGETEVRITQKHKIWLSLFKRKYTFVMLYHADYWRALTPKEKETGIYPGRTTLQAVDLDEIMPIIGKEKKEKKKHILPKRVKGRKLFMGEFEVSKEIYIKYKDSDTALIRYKFENPEIFEFL